VAAPDPRKARLRHRRRPAERPVELRPQSAGGRPFIQGYGAGRFRVGGTLLTGSVIVLPDRAEPWAVTDPGAVTLASLAPVVAAASSLDLLLLGCGAAPFIPAAELRDELRRLGVTVEAMDTGAACRTFNVLLAEDRRVVAALIAVA